MLWNKRGKLQQPQAFIKFVSSNVLLKLHIVWMCQCCNLYLRTVRVSKYYVPDIYMNIIDALIFMWMFYVFPHRAKYHKLKYGTELNQGVKTSSYQTGMTSDILSYCTEIPWGWPLAACIGTWHLARLSPVVSETSPWTDAQTLF